MIIYKKTIVLQERLFVDCLFYIIFAVIIQTYG